MRLRSNVIAVLLALASLGLSACKGPHSRDAAKSPEADPWADYKGTYATGGTPPNVNRSDPKPVASEPKALFSPAPTAIEESIPVSKSPKKRAAGSKKAPSKK